MKGGELNMNKMLVIVFPTESDAFNGLDALEELDEKGDITLYAESVVVKDMEGNVTVRQSANDGPIGTAVGMLTGGLVGLLGGPFGAVVGATIGGSAGLTVDIMEAAINQDFLDEVSNVFLPGTAMVVAEVDEEWVTPVDVRMDEFYGIVFRKPKSQVVDDQIEEDSETFREEVNEMNAELKEKSAKTKANAQKSLKSAKSRLETTAKRADEKLDQVNSEAKAKISALESQMKDAQAAQKAKIQKRIAQVKADQKKRSEKLQKAKLTAKEALTK